MMRDQGEMLPLFRVHILGTAEVADIDHVGFQQLADAAVGLVAHHHGRDRPDFRAGDAVGQETQFPQGQIHFAKYGLALIERNEGNFGLDHDASRPAWRGHAPAPRAPRPGYPS